jgi:Tfp pilus assembly protein PilF
MAGLKDLDGAVKEIEEAIQLDPQQASTYANLGALQQARGNTAEAEAAFKQAVQTDPKSVVARLALANFYWASGRRPEAWPPSTSRPGGPPTPSRSSRRLRPTGGQQRRSSRWRTTTLASGAKTRR